MAHGKSLEKEKSRKYTLYTNNNQPIKRATPKIHMSKKDRRKARAGAAEARAKIYAARESMVKAEGFIKDTVIEAIGE